MLFFFDLGLLILNFAFYIFHVVCCFCFETETRCQTRCQHDANAMPNLAFPLFLNRNMMPNTRIPAAARRGDFAELRIWLMGFRLCCKSRTMAPNQPNHSVFRPNMFTTMHSPTHSLIRAIQLSFYMSSNQGLTNSLSAGKGRFESTGNRTRR